MVTPNHSTDAQWASAQALLQGGMLSIIMPAFNLGTVIAANVQRVRKVFLGRLPFEIIVVDDGSADHTASELRRMQAAVPEMRPVFMARNGGKGAALRHGFEAARGRLILFLDADLDLPPEQAPQFFDTMAQQEADVVIGSKQHALSDLHYPWHRRLMSNGYYWLIKLLFGLPLRDTQTGMKLFRRETLEWAFPRLLVKAYAFDLELLSLIHLKGFRIAETPVRLRFQGRWDLIRFGMAESILRDTLAVFYRLRLLQYYQSVPDLKKPEPPPLISILIACPAPTPMLEQGLIAISRQTYRNYEVILLPDEPSNRVWPSWVREVPTGRLRPAEKRNLGAREAHGEILAFLDDDAFPVENWLAHAVEFFSLPNVAAVGGPGVTPPESPYLARLGGRVYQNRLVSGTQRYRYWPGLVREVDDYPSCNLLVRTDVFHAVGGFRTDFWPGEDTFLCMEITRRLGRRIYYDPWAIVYHHRRPLFLPHLRQIGRYALHRGHFARHFPATSRRLAYMLPTLFLLGLIGGAAAAAIWPALRPAFLAAISLYAFLTLLSSISPNPATWLLTWLGVVATHLVYGARFLQGWSSKGLPGSVQRFDHPSETKALS